MAVSAAPSLEMLPGGTRSVTLLELVQAVADETNDDREIVATVVYLLRSGRVRLCGSFRGAPIEAFGRR